MKKITSICGCDLPHFNAGLSLFLSMLLIFTSACSEDSFDKSEAILKASNTVGTLYFGHQIFTRMTSEPQSIKQTIENPDFEHFEDSFTLFIQNGNSKTTRVTSAEILIDGNPVFLPSDFSKNKTFLSREISGITNESVLEVRLTGQPGSFIDLWVEGTLKPGRAYIGSQGGTVMSEDGCVIISIPENSVDTKLLFSITESENKAPNIFMSNDLDRTYELAPSGITFSNPVSVLINYGSWLSTITNPANIGIIHWDDTGSINNIPVHNDLVCNQLEFTLDHFSRIQGTEFPNNTWAVFKFKWNIPVIKWYLEPPAQVGSYLTENRIRDALKAWENETSSFSFEPTDDIDDANIVFIESYTTKELIGALSCFFYTGDITVAQTCFDNGIMFSDYNLDETNQVSIYFASNELSEVYAKHTLVHEIGHALGLAHPVSEEETPVMAQGAQLWQGLHQWDIEALHYHYAPKDECFPNLPNPILTFSGTEEYIDAFGTPYIRYRLGVSNYSVYPDELFNLAPDLPPCGLNEEASRSWVYIYNGNGSYIYGFCGLEAAEHLNYIWFGVPKGQAPPDNVYIDIIDRRCGLEYTSQILPIPKL